MIAGSVVVVVVVAVILANTADSGGKKHSATKQTTTTPPVAVPAALKLAIGKVNIQNTGVPTKVKKPVRDAVLSAAQAYVDDAVIAPLKLGKVDNAYERLFDQGVRAAASGPDRGVLTEAKLGTARGELHATASKVDLDAIGDQTGKPALVATTFVMTVKTTTPAGPITVRQITEFTFANVFGKWFVTAYDVGVHRTVGATTTSKTATTGGSIANGAAE